MIKLATTDRPLDEGLAVTLARYVAAVAPLIESLRTIKNVTVYTDGGFARLLVTTPGDVLEAMAELLATEHALRGEG